MKKAGFILVAVGGMLLSGQALAVSYSAVCQTCNGGGASTAWLTAAVSLAQSKGAVSGDWLHLCKDFPAATVLHDYLVNSSPVTGTGNITYVTTTGFSDLTCADLFIE